MLEKWTLAEFLHEAGALHLGLLNLYNHPFRVLAKFYKEGDFVNGARD